MNIKNVLVVGAMEVEIKSLKTLLSSSNYVFAIKNDNKVKYKFKNNVNITVLCSGIGMLNSSFEVMKELNRFNYDLVINIGTVSARGIYKIGDIVKIGKSFNGDFDLTRFKYSLYEVPGVGKSIDLEFGDSLCFSVSKFLDSSSTIKRFKDYVVDMELYGIALVSKRFDIPLISYKVVTDVSDGDLSVYEHESTIENLSEKLCNCVYNHEIYKLVG